jgi:hypothetical protein
MCGVGLGLSLSRARPVETEDNHLRLTILLIALAFAATSVHPVFAQPKSEPAAKSDKAAAAKKEPLDINTASEAN